MQIVLNSKRTNLKRSGLEAAVYFCKANEGSPSQEGIDREYLSSRSLTYFGSSDQEQDSHKAEVLMLDGILWNSIIT